MSVDKLLVWDRDQATQLIADLQERVKPFGYHIALGGGVLNYGFSTKDVDLYFLPLDRKDVPVDADALLTFLVGLWGASTPIGSRDPNYPPNVTYKHRETFYPLAGRIDAFIH